MRGKSRSAPAREASRRPAAHSRNRDLAPAARSENNSSAFAHRVEADLAALPRRDAMNGLSRLLCEWLHDQDWVAAAAAIPASPRRKLLAELGAAAFCEDWGGYATCLRRATESLDYIWTADEREKFLGEHTQLLLVNLADTLDFRGGAVDALFDRVQIVGGEHLRGVLDAGRGALLLSVHQSHPGFGFLHPHWQGVGISTVANLGSRSAPHASLLLDGMRGRVEVLPTTVAALRPMLARLAGNGLVAIYVDYLYPGTPGTVSALLGGPVMVASAPLSLALRTGAAVIPVSVAHACPASESAVQVEFGAPLPLGQLDPRDPQSLSVAALAFGIVMEGMIRRAPSTWRLWPSLAYRWRMTEREIAARDAASDH